jgi:hypothetical protein
MPHNLMNQCEAKRLFLRDEKKVREWTVTPVSRLETGGSTEIRCMHCHGAVRVHKQKVAHGPADHVEHLSRQDSTGCMGGHHFDGNHRMSLIPVV